MTEADWLACTSVKRMLDHIPYHVSKRKWRLLAIAFCRRIGFLLTQEQSRQAVEAAEKWAEGLLATKELRRLHDAAEPYRLGLAQSGLQEAPGAACGAATPSKEGTFRTAFSARAAIEVSGGSAEAEERQQCDLIRDILGYPYRRVAFQPTLRK